MQDQVESSPARISAALDQHLQNVARYCEMQVESGLTESRSPAQLQALVQHLYEVADYEIGQAGEGCEPYESETCLQTCDGSTPVTVAEAITIASYLKDVAFEYAPPLQGTCPFFVGGMCVIRDVRPLKLRSPQAENQPCRALSREHRSLAGPYIAQDAAIRAVEHGLRVGLRFNYLDPDFVPLSAAIDLLESSAPGDEYLAGSALPEDRLLRVPNDPVKRFHVSGGARPAFRPLALLSEPTGFNSSITEKSLREYYDLGLNHGLFPEAIDTLKLGTAAQEVAKIVVPRCYANEAEILEWRDHFVVAMKSFDEGDFEPGEAFNAISSHRTASLAYQGLDDKDIMVEHGRIMQSVTQSLFPELCELPKQARKSGRVRVGYLSANMHGSNGCRWALGWLRHHGRSIESYALNAGTLEDGVSRQFKAAADHYFQLVGTIPDNVRFIRSLCLDVLIITDLGLHGFNTSYATFRMAPIQATAWGHPVTSGFPHLELYLSSDLMEPINAQALYSEELVRLPNSGLCYAPIEDFPSKDRAYFGLHEEGPLIVNAQTKPKLLPQHDHLYREIAERAGVPVVFLEGVQPCDTIVTKTRMERSGVPSVWLPHLSRQDFLALLELADVSLDPPLWSGGNTTIEALALGTPVVTLPGPWMRSRHSYAFLRLANAEGLIADDERDFVELACDFERQKAALRHAEPDALFQDLTPVHALDRLIEERVGG